MRRAAVARRGRASRAALGTLETDYLNGEIALLGRINGVPTPVNIAPQQLAADAARAGVAPGSRTLAELTEQVRAFTHARVTESA